MAYIQPNTDIYLLSGINWTNNYEDTVYFASKATQFNYLKGKVKETFTAQSYQRHSKNTLRILATADKIFDCNYMMFQNKSYGNKWFYAFITNCEYINDNTTEIAYEIDEIQTWFWDLKLGQCFVEREIPKTDNLYENLVPENLECGEYEAGAYIPVELGEPYYLVQSCTNALGQNTIEFCNGLPSTIIYFYCPVYDEATNPRDTQIYKLLAAWFEGLGDNNPENIINISIVPEKLAKSAYDIINPSTGERTRGTVIMEDVDVPALAFSQFHGYKPKNNKLFTFPYSFIRVSNNSGQLTDYKLENFRTVNILDPTAYFPFRLFGIVNGLPSAMLTPLDYQGIEGSHINVDNSIVMTNFPTAPWVCDTYRAYLAQNKASIATSVLSSVINSISGIASGANSAIGNQAINNNTPNTLPISQISSEMGRNSGIIRAATSFLSGAINVASSLAKISDMKRTGDSAQGLTNADALLVTIGRQRFDIYNYSIKPEMAKIIDDYFSAYGYAQHKIKVPNIEPRRYWGYTQTKGCILKGSCPATSKAFISSVFDKGIRFWSSNEPDVFGNYELNNSP